MARKAANKAEPPHPETGGEAEVVALPGLPVSGGKAAAILGLKLTGQWHHRSASILAHQWRTSDDWVRQLSVRVDEALQQLHDKQPARRLVVHQLLVALTELSLVTDAAKRIALRVKVASELAKVTGLVKPTVLKLGGEPPPPLTDDALKGSP